MAFHQVSLFAVRGLDRSVAVFAFQVTAFTSVAGNLGTGYLLDHVSPRQVLALLLALLAVSMVLLQSMTTPWEAMLYATLWGVTSGAFRVVDATVWAKYFGRRHLGSIRGATMIGTVGGAALGAYPLGLSYDLTGNYGAALTMLLVLPAAIALLSFFIKRPATTPS
jgi:predicted MFS family arabinose efflux permease